MDLERYYHGSGVLIAEEDSGKRRLLIHYKKDGIKPDLLLQVEILIDGHWRFPEEGSGVVVGRSVFPQLRQVLSRALEE